MFPHGSDPILVTKVNDRSRVTDPLQGNVGGAPLFFKLVYASAGGAASKAVCAAPYVDSMNDHLMVKQVGGIIFLIRF